jgi:hypothetical protein
METFNQQVQKHHRWEQNFNWDEMILHLASHSQGVSQKALFFSRRNIHR